MTFDEKDIGKYIVYPSGKMMSRILEDLKEEGE